MYAPFDLRFAAISFAISLFVLVEGCPVSHGVPKRKAQNQHGMIPCPQLNMKRPKSLHTAHSLEVSNEDGYNFSIVERNRTIDLQIPAPSILLQLVQVSFLRRIFRPLLTIE